MKPVAWTARATPAVALAKTSEAPWLVPTTAVPLVNVGVTVTLGAPKRGEAELATRLAVATGTALTVVLAVAVSPAALVTVSVKVVVAPSGPVATARPLLAAALS